MDINLRHLIACSTSGLLLVVLAPVTASAAPAEMTPEQAGAFYLRHECRNNVALFLFIDEVTRNGYIRPADVEKRFSRFKKETRKLGVAQTRFATNLLAPPDLWPAPVAGSVQAVADAGLRSGDLLGRAAEASKPQGWWRKFRKANRQMIEVEDGKTEIRTLLNLSETEC
ncbi:MULTISPECIES: hypothetical protein [unclassified Nocardioides]|uniref:hypothetical protein n=1 Tax=unclassified Nocardioides TaxID=2615069 RepID=UPI00360DDD3A